jgi:hypothetical protein
MFYRNIAFAPRAKTLLPIQTPIFIFTTTQTRLLLEHHPRRYSLGRRRNWDRRKKHILDRCDYHLADVGLALTLGWVMGVYEVVFAGLNGAKQSNA